MGVPGRLGVVVVVVVMVVVVVGAVVPVVRSARVVYGMAERPRRVWFHLRAEMTAGLRFHPAPAAMPGSWRGLSAR